MKILKFYSNVCTPCRVLEKVLDKLEVENVESINVQENTELAETFNVKNLPTLIKLSENNEEISRLSGMHTVQEIKEFVLDK